jgi:hypothetical protein
MRLWLKLNRRLEGISKQFSIKTNFKAQNERNSTLK